MAIIIIIITITIFLYVFVYTYTQNSQSHYKRKDHDIWLVYNNDGVLIEGQCIGGTDICMYVIEV